MHITKFKSFIYRLLISFMCMFWYTCVFRDVMNGMDSIKFTSEGCDKPRKESASHRPLKTQ